MKTLEQLWDELRERRELRRGDEVWIRGKVMCVPQSGWRGADAMSKYEYAKSFDEQCRTWNPPKNSKRAKAHYRCELVRLHGGPHYNSIVGEWKRRGAKP